MIPLILVVLGAFEFSFPAGPAASMLAGAALSDWRHSVDLNPALAAEAGRLGLLVSYARPYGLSGLNWSCAMVHWQTSSVSVTAGARSLTLAAYREQALDFALSGSAMRDFRAGVGVHVLTSGMASVGNDVVPAVDAGLCFLRPAFSVGLAAASINSPRWCDGSELPARVTVAGTWRPVQPLVLALDLSRSAGEETGRLGVEFRLAPPAALHLGVAVPQLLYAGGLTVRVGPVAVDYAWQSHPQLQGTHVVGVSAGW